MCSQCLNVVPKFQNEVPDKKKNLVANVCHSLQRQTVWEEKKQDPKADTGEANYGLTKGKPFIMTD